MCTGGENVRVYMDADVVWHGVATKGGVGVWIKCRASLIAGREACGSAYDPGFWMWTMGPKRTLLDTHILKKSWF